MRVINFCLMESFLNVRILSFAPQNVKNQQFVGTFYFLAVKGVIQKSANARWFHARNLHLCRLCLQTFKIQRTRNLRQAYQSFDWIVFLDGRQVVIRKYRLKMVRFRFKRPLFVFAVRSLVPSFNFDFFQFELSVWTRETERNFLKYFIFRPFFCALNFKIHIKFLHS